MRTQIDVGVLGYGGLTTMTSEFYYEVYDDAPHVTGTCSVRGRWARSGSVTPYRPQQPEVASPDQGIGSHGPPRSYPSDSPFRCRSHAKSYTSALRVGPLGGLSCSQEGLQWRVGKCCPTRDEVSYLGQLHSYGTHWSTVRTGQSHGQHDYQRICKVHGG